jgi:hypothetical protein
VIGLSQRLVYDTQHSQETGIHVAEGIRSRNPSKRAAADSKLKALGRWNFHGKTGLNIFVPYKIL